MADNYITNPGAGGVIFASDEDALGNHWPFIKLAWGARDVFNEVDDAVGKRLPVIVSNADFAINNFPAGFLSAQSGAWTVAVNNFPASQAVTGPLTDAQLRAVAVPVSGPLTDAQLRATPVPVSGTVTANAGTNLNTSLLLLEATFTTRINTLGQKAMAASTPVVLASDQSSIPVAGTAAHDAGISGNPVRIAGRGMSVDFAAVTTSDVVDLLASLLGKQVILPHALPGATWQYAGATGGIVDTTAVTIKAAGAAGVRNYVTALQVINGHATVSTEVAIRDGAAGTVIHRGFAQAAGGGYALQFPTPLRSTAATLLEVVCITTGAAVRVSAQGYEAGE